MSTFGTISYSIEIVFACVGSILNLVQFVILIRSKPKCTLFEINLQSLCIVNFLSSLCFIAFGVDGIYDLKMSVIHLKEGWFEVISPVMFRSSLVLSFTHVLMIAAQRLMASIFPFRFRMFCTKRKLMSCVVILWVANMVYGVLQFYQVGPVGAILVYGIFVCDLSLIILYSALSYLLIRRSKDTAAMSWDNSRQAETSRKVLWYSICVTLVFSVTTLPLAVSHCVKHALVLDIFIDTFPPMTAVVNSLLYFVHGRRSKRPALNHRVHNFQQSLENVCLEDQTSDGEKGLEKLEKTSDAAGNMQKGAVPEHLMEEPNTKEQES